jgi:GDP-L-fucose synthase
MAKPKIVITGGNGFLGKALVANLRAKGYDDVHTFSSMEFDLVSQADTDKMFFYYRPDVVIHLAARVGGIGANMRNPGKFCYDNLAMGINVIDSAHKYGAKKLIAAGTVCSFPKFSPVPFKEDDLWKGYPEETNAPYGLAKKMLLVMCQSYRKQYGCNFTYLLPVNLYGPHDSFDLENSHVIPAMMRKFHEAKVRGDPSMTLWGDGTSTREFLYVDDCAEAFAQSMEKYDGEEPINIGTGREIPMRGLAAMIRDVVGYEGAILWDTSKPNGQPRRRLDTSRAKEMLGWESRVTLEDGLAKTYEWFASQASARASV